jgi:hypothetical protein
MDLGVGGRIILKCILRGNRVGCCEPVDVAQIRDQWWVLMNMIMNLHFL